MDSTVKTGVSFDEDLDLFHVFDFGVMMRTNANSTLLLKRSPVS
jgi:hypothetical protein